ncbi:inorganic phosphate transporter, partial [Paracoccus sp. P2]
NPMRAYCVALSAAITVILASALGLPVSSTHIAVGAIFGVGFFREWDAERRLRQARMAVPRPADLPAADLPPADLPPDERRRRKLVRRLHVLTIAAAWVVTVPAAAMLSAILFLVLRQIAA